MKEIVLATKNGGKVIEMTKLLAELPLAVLSLRDFDDMPDAVEDGDTFAANALIKARFYCRQTGKACLADDSGLEVDVLGGAPGVYSARYAGEHASDADNNQKLLAALAGVPENGRTGRFRSVLAFVDVNGVEITTEGTVEGILLDRPRGNDGFGYDPLFFVPGIGKTLAEISPDEKNTISHRGQALRRMQVKLKELWA